MRAWQFTDTGEPLVLVDTEEPTAAPGEVVIDVKAAGLCHSDVGMLDDPGWRDLLQFRPITLGHEVAGVISAVGEGVTDYAVGDRVGVCPSTPSMPGYARDGGYGAKSSARVDDIVRIPENVSFAQAAAGTDAGMTSYHAVVIAGKVQAGEKVGIIGLGGLGQIGAQTAIGLGAEVYIAEINEAVWPLARELGATDVRTSITDYEGMEFDLVVDFAGFNTTGAAVDMIRRDGRVVQVGMGKLETTISITSIILKQASIIGSNGGTVEDVAAVYQLFAEGKVTPTLTEITFDEIPEGLDKLRRGEVVGRLVANMEK